MGHLGHGRSVAAALDPVLVPCGFAGDQYGEGGEDAGEAGQTIFCAAHVELAARYPWLPQAREPAPGPGACDDLTVQTSADGRLDGVHLEGLSLAQTLDAVGRPDDAAALRALTGRPVESALPVLRDVLSRLLQAPG